MIRFLVLLGLASSVLAVEPYEQIEDGELREVGEDHVFESAWRMSVQGEYVLQTVKFYESTKPEGADWDLRRTVRKIVRTPRQVFSQVVREQLTSTKVEDRDEEGNPMHDDCMLRGFGELIHVEDMDLEGHSGGGSRFSMAGEGEKAPVLYTSRSFRFNPHEGKVRKKVRFTMQVMDLKKATELAKEAGVELPEAAEWTVKLPDVIAEGTGDEGK